MLHFDMGVQWSDAVTVDDWWIEQFDGMPEMMMLHRHVAILTLVKEALGMED